MPEGHKAIDVSNIRTVTGAFEQLYIFFNCQYSNVRATFSSRPTRFECIKLRLFKRRWINASCSSLQQQHQNDAGSLKLAGAINSCTRQLITVITINCMRKRAAEDWLHVYVCMSLFGKILIYTQD